MRRNMLRRVLPICAVVSIFVLLIVCSIWGDSIYQWITPKVPVKKTSHIQMGQEEYTKAPKKAVTSDSKIYYVTAEEGISRTIYRIYCTQIEYTVAEYEEDKVLISTSLPENCYVVTDPEQAKDLADGTKVVLKR